MTDGAHVCPVLVILALAVLVVQDHPLDTGRGEVMVSPDTISIRAHITHIISEFIFTHFLIKFPLSSICNAWVHMRLSHGDAGWP